MALKFGTTLYFNMNAYSSWKSEKSLLRLAKEGKTEAVKSLIAMLLKPAHGLAWYILRNQSDAEEVVQEAFLQLWRSAEKFEGNASLKTYFTKIVVNECHTFIRKNPQHAEIEDEDSSHEGNSNFVIDLRINQEIIQRALNELTAKQRMALVLWAFHDLTASEIGTVMDLNKNAVDQLLWRAKTALREKLAER